MNTMNTTYQEFLKRKSQGAPQAGFEPLWMPLVPEVPAVPLWVGLAREQLALELD